MSNYIKHAAKMKIYYNKPKSHHLLVLSDFRFIKYYKNQYK